VCRAALDDGRLRRVLPHCVPLTKFGTRITAFSTPERTRLARIQALLAFLRTQLG
jgi:hypothetical protein